jgi:hypothetical protein
LLVAENSSFNKMLIIIFPGKFESLQALPRLVLITCLRPDRLAYSVSRFITTQLPCLQLCEQVSTELAVALESRLVLLMPGRGIDLTSGLEKFARATTNVRLVSPGQGQLQLITK